MKQRGFTLVETLVVLVIMGLLAATVVLTWTGRGALREDAAALAARATLAGQESVVGGAAMGLHIDAEGYAFFRLKDGVWREVDDERAFRRQAWRDGVVSQVRREGFSLTRPQSIGAGKPYAPAIVFDPTGVWPDFSVTLAEGAQRILVAGVRGGAVEVKEAARE